MLKYVMLRLLFIYVFVGHYLSLNKHKRIKELLGLLMYAILFLCYVLIYRQAQITTTPFHKHKCSHTLLSSSTQPSSFPCQSHRPTGLHTNRSSFTTTPPPRYHTKLLSKNLQLFFQKNTSLSLCPGYIK